MKRRSKSAPPDAPNTLRAVALVEELMAIEGPSGDEGQVADAIRESLLAAGADPKWIRMDSAGRKTPRPSKVGNLIFKLPGKGPRQPRRMFSAHMDTVPICIGSRPKRKGGFFRSGDPDKGIGADDRAGVAVVLNTALEMLAGDPPRAPLTFCWFVQEEIGLHGARCVNQRMLGGPAMAFNFDGGSPAKVTIGATGGYRLQIDVEGIASHAGNNPERGVSAIAIASLAIADLQRGGWHGRIQQEGGRGTSNVGVIQGGAATNVVTDRVQLRAEARSHDAKFRKQIVREIEQAFRQACREVVSSQGKRGRVRFDGRLDYDSFLLPSDAPAIQHAQTAVLAAGLEPQLAVANGGVDANWLNAHGIPTVTLGCGQVNPHMTSEMLNIAEFEDACRVAWRLAV